MRIAVTGSTGMVGSALLPALAEAGHQVRRVVRGKPGPDDLVWEPSAGRLDPGQLASIDAVVHLSGEDMGRRWTESVRARIRESRVRSTEVLSQAMARAEPRPRLLITASAVGYYGSRGDEVLTEESAPGSDFLATLVRDWEAATAPAKSAGVRVVHARFGVVLAPQGGMLQRVLPIFRKGLGGILGSGNQWLSWITVHDLVHAIRFLIDREDISGAVNVTSPEPVTNAEFTRALGQVLGRPTIFFAPAFGLELVYGEMARDTILASQRTVPQRLANAGFEFRYPAIRDALAAALDRG